MGIPALEDKIVQMGITRILNAIYEPIFLDCSYVYRKGKDCNVALKIQDWWKVLEAKLRRHYQYYGVSGNHVSIKQFYRETYRLVLKWINRRSQNKSMNLKEFYAYLEKYSLPNPKIKHNLYISVAMYE